MIVEFALLRGVRAVARYVAKLDEGSDESGAVDLLGKAGTGAIRIALLFGSAAVALSIILTPMAQNQVARSSIAPDGIDRIATGATPLGQNAPVRTREYTVRRSVLQSPGGVCIINSNGVRTGSC